MSEPRFKRDDPQRTEPNRDFTNAFQDADPWEGTAAPDADPWGGTSAGTAGMEPPDWLGAQTSGDPAYSPDFATQAVRKGYDLLRDQMDRGQQYAEQMRGGFGAMPDLRSIFEQTLSFYSDAVLRWFDPILPPRPPQGGSAASDLPVQVISARRNRSSLRLLPGVRAPFDTWALHARDRAKPPLQDVRFVKSPAGGVALLVRVPDSQPADLYMGVITRRPAGQPAGVVSVQIFAH